MMSNEGGVVLVHLQPGQTSYAGGSRVPELLQPWEEGSWKETD